MSSSRHHVCGQIITLFTKRDTGTHFHDKMCGLVGYPVNQRRLYNDYPTCSKRHGTTTTKRVPNVHGVWNTMGSRVTNVAVSLGYSV